MGRPLRGGAGSKPAASPHHPTSHWYPSRHRRPGHRPHPRGLPHPCPSHPRTGHAALSGHAHSTKSHRGGLRGSAHPPHRSSRGRCAKAARCAEAARWWCGGAPRGGGSGSRGLHLCHRHVAGSRWRYCAARRLGDITQIDGSALIDNAPRVGLRWRGAARVGMRVKRRTRGGREGGDGGGEVDTA